MKTAQELYPELDMWVSDYSPMLKEFGDIAIQVDDDDYQGDSRVLYQDGERFGFLQFGWGSCSGCDALQGCNNINEVQELMNELWNEIQWFETARAALLFFETHDWEGDYSWHQKETREFVDEVKKFLQLHIANKGE